MVPRISLCFFLVLIFGAQQVVLIKYDLDDAINDISFFIPGSKIVLTTAVKLWSVYGELKQLIDPNSTHIEKSLDELNSKLVFIDDKLDHISNSIDDLSDRVNDVKDSVDKGFALLPQEINLDSKMSSIYNDINKVNLAYENFRRYNNASKIHANDTLLNFANKVVDHGLSELPAVLNQIHQTLVEEHSKINMLNILANKRQASSMVCKYRQSPQHTINTLYSKIMKIEIKNLIMIQFAYSIKQMFSNNLVNYQTELEEAKHNFYQRTSKSLLEIKKSMIVAQRDFWRCDPVELEENKTYEKLGPIFQAYFIKEKDTRYDGNKGKFTNSCAHKCADRTNATDLCRSDFCKKHGKPCLGNVRDCKTSDPKMNICIADKSSRHRFEYIELKSSHEIIGQKKVCHNPVKINPHLFSKCEMCLCTCENTISTEDRYFNLKSVVSDVKNKK